MFCKKGVLKNLAKFTRKHLCQGLFFDNVAGGVISDFRQATKYGRRTHEGHMFFIKELTLRLLQAHILRKFQKLYLKTVIDSPCNVQNSLILASLLTTYFVLLQSVFH